MVDPLTGIYAALAKNEVIGAKLAVEQINKKGGVLGRPVELLVEDSANDVGTAVQKARKLIDRDQIQFLIGDVNSAIALALGQVSNEKGILHVVSGGHTDGVTGKDCHWNVFRVCNTTWMECAAIAAQLYKDYGKKWYYITPDYAFGHTLQSSFEKLVAGMGGSKVGAGIFPITTTDFSSYLIQAKAAKPDVMVVLAAGDNAVNCLKQIVQFGLHKEIHVAGAQQELEVLEGLPPEARIGSWVFEWYWNQPKVPHVADFVTAIKKVNDGKVPTARHWFGFASAWTYALVANHAKTLDGVKLAHALENMALPPEVALMPYKAFYRAGDHQLMPTLFVGNAQSKGSSEEDLFSVTSLVEGSKAALPVSETGCVLKYPA
jgi:branched-chain amino acid transport system substrate-binding protein